MSRDDAEAAIESLAAGSTSDAFDDASRAMLAYALKLTRTPQSMSLGDVETLRTVGFDDRAIHDICAVTSYYAFVNRIADGLGVELEDGPGG